MSNTDPSICIVIPTRNRATLAKNAIQSALADEQLDVRVIVSDNSTDELDLADLSAYCEMLDVPKLSYIRPPAPIGLAEHWEWAMQQALKNTKSSHILFLTDRMIFKDTELQKIFSVVRSFPNDVITYSHDVIDDSRRPIQLVQESWTGNLYSITSEELLRLSAKMIHLHVLPRMMNCVVPRTVFERILSDFGNIFDDTAPDFMFAYRCLAISDRILYLDRTSLVHYAQNLSTGGNQSKGIFDKATIEHFKKTGNMDFNYAAPIPGFITLNNSIIHAYCHVKDQSQNSKFPAINQELYYKMIDHEIGAITNLEIQHQMRVLLSKQIRDPKELTRQKFLKLRNFIFSWRCWNVKFRWILTGSKFLPVWKLFNRYPGIKMPAVRQTISEFETVESALKFARTEPSRCNSGISYLETLAEFKPVPNTTLS